METNGTLVYLRQCVFSTYRPIRPLRYITRCSCKSNMVCYNVSVGAVRLPKSVKLWIAFISVTLTYSGPTLFAQSQFRSVRILTQEFIEQLRSRQNTSTYNKKDRYFKLVYLTYYAYRFCHDWCFSSLLYGLGCTEAIWARHSTSKLREQTISLDPSQRCFGMSLTQLRGLTKKCCEVNYSAILCLLIFFFIIPSRFQSKKETTCSLQTVDCSQLVYSLAISDQIKVRENRIDR